MEKRVTELYELAKKRDIEVLCFPLPITGALAVMDRRGSCTIGIDPMQLQSEADEKVKLAHELGHCLTGSFYNRFTPLDIREKHERRAERWAIHNLVPRSKFNEALRRGYTEVWQLAELFDVTEPFMQSVVEYYQGK